VSGRRARARRAFGMLVTVLVVAAALAALAQTRRVRELEVRLNQRSLAAPTDAKNRLRAALRRAGALAVRPPDDLEFVAPRSAEGRCPDPAVEPRAVARADMPSSRVAPPEGLVAGRTLAVLWLEPCRIERLHELRRRRGREFEEVGWFSLFEGGELRFASAVGVRMHGWTTRRRPPHSYRVYFRGAVGEREFPAALLSDGLASSPRRLVIKPEIGRDEGGELLPFLEPMVLAIGQRLGARVPSVRPVAFSLNGAPPRPYRLLEHVGGDYLERHFGHRDFDLVRAKTEDGPAYSPALREELDWLARAPAPLTAAAAAQRYDLDALLDGLTTALISADSDSFQEVLLRDRRGELAGGRWFPVLWDVNMSRLGTDPAASFGDFRDLLPMLVAEWPEAFRRSRAIQRMQRLPFLLHRRLLREDPEYRARLAARLSEAFDDQLTEEFAAGLGGQLRRWAAEVGLVDLGSLARLERALAERPEVLRRKARTHLGADAPMRLAAGTD
jgi:hypothetical protein